MTTTTLMTFLLQAPSSTRFVKLFGSWDNFSTPYSMERDYRIGSGHWRGCHTFKNIICDGEVNSSPRDGGLMMGGTYWYYYQLDHEIDFHNPAEPTTTACPLLPGQTVNVLHVPTRIGSGNRSRDGSVSSTSSEVCTMNPKDKYLNPRPVPKPSLPKLSISASLSKKPSLSSPATPTPTPVTSKPVEKYVPPLSVSPSRRLRIGHNPSLAKSRSISPRRPGFRAAINQIASPRSAGVNNESTRGRRGAWIDREMNIGSPTLISRSDPDRICFPLSAPATVNNSREPSPEPSSYNLQTETVQAAVTGIPRHILDQDGGRINPLGAHRVRSARSRSRDPSPLRRSMSLESDEDHPLKESVLSCLKPMETLQEQNTPGFMPPSLASLTESNATLAALEELKDKRLPTLPNSPSSVLDEMDTDNDTVETTDEPQSHFSALTTDTNLESEQRSNHFSDFSFRSMGSPSSAYSSTFDHKSPSLSGHTDQSSYPTSPYHLPSMPDTPCMNYGLDRCSLSASAAVESITETGERTPHGVPADLDAHMKGLFIDGARTPSVSSFEPAALNVGSPGPQLPGARDASELTLKRAESVTPDARSFRDMGVQTSDSGWNGIKSLKSQVTMIQQLMDELSYLGGAIRE